MKAFIQIADVCPSFAFVFPPYRLYFLNWFDGLTAVFVDKQLQLHGLDRRRPGVVLNFSAETDDRPVEPKDHRHAGRDDQTRRLRTKLWGLQRSVGESERTGRSFSWFVFF